MNSQIPYDTNGKINAIPIIIYHNLTNSMQDYNKMASTITVDLFAQQRDMYNMIQTIMFLI